MIEKEREIHYDIYARADANGGKLAADDYAIVFTAHERFGYGVYSPRVFQRDGKCYVRYYTDETCD